tara:strand:- start:2232 stop:2480 length:249 start_codon:yes stop_codon:yes gene_type:complete
MIRAGKKKLATLVHNDRQRLTHYVISAVIFFISYALLYWCETNITPSLHQELMSLASLVIGGLAFIWAMTMHVFYILSRTIK